MGNEGQIPAKFDRERFVENCRAALSERAPEAAMREVVAAAVADGAAVLRELGEPKEAGLHPFHVSKELTVLNVVWAPWMVLMPHEHRMWAVIGIYSGREDNIFWRRLGEPGKSHVEAAGARSLSNGDVVTLGKDIVHSVLNPIPRLTAALHIYGGDFFGTPRSEWDPGTLEEQPFDVDRAQRLFREANARAARPITQP